MNPNNAATITPLDPERQCEAGGCEHAELVARVEPDVVHESRVLCPTHRVEWLREVADG